MHIWACDVPLEVGRVYNQHDTLRGIMWDEDKNPHRTFTFRVMKQVTADDYIEQQRKLGKDTEWEIQYNLDRYPFFYLLAMD